MGVRTTILSNILHYLLLSTHYLVGLLDLLGYLLGDLLLRWEEQLGALALQQLLGLLWDDLFGDLLLEFLLLVDFDLLAHLQIIRQILTFGFDGSHFVLLFNLTELLLISRAL